MTRYRLFRPPQLTLYRKQDRTVSADVDVGGNQGKDAGGPVRCVNVWSDHNVVGTKGSVGAITVTEEIRKGPR